MARPRKPTHLLELGGAFRKNPQRRRNGEPHQLAALQERPVDLTPVEAACWDRLLAISTPGVLKTSDEAIVELTARLWAKVKTGKFKASDVSNLRLCCQQLGLTPAARSLVVVPTPAKQNEFAEI